MEEIWKAIPGYEGRYEVSNYGRVKSLPKRKKGTGSYMTETRILVPRAVGKGREYLAVILFDSEHKAKQWRVHRLVAIAFIPNPNGYNEINHKDEIKGNNRVENLEWCSRSYNVRYGHGNEKRKYAIAKPIAMFDDDGNEVMRFLSLSDGAKYVGVHPASISHVVGTSRRIKKHLWRFL